MSSRRVEFDEKTRVKRLTFAGFKCEGIVTLENGEKTRCNAALTRARVEFDHDIAAELGGPATFDNCRALCKICHRAKYPSDAGKIAKAKRSEAKFIGAEAPTDRPIPARAKPPKPEPRPAASGVSEIARRYARADVE